MQCIHQIYFLMESNYLNVLQMTKIESIKVAFDWFKYSILFYSSKPTFYLKAAFTSCSKLLTNMIMHKRTQSNRKNKCARSEALRGPIMATKNIRTDSKIAEQAYSVVNLRRNGQWPLRIRKTQRILKRRRAMTNKRGCPRNTPDDKNRTLRWYARNERKCNEGIN